MRYQTAFVQLVFVALLTFVIGCSQSEQAKHGNDATQDPVASGNTNAPQNSSAPDGPRQETRKPTPDRPDPINLTARGSFQRSTTTPTIIDTRTFTKQIARIEPWEGEKQSSSVFRPVKKGQPQLGPGPRNNLRPGGMLNDSRGQMESFFPGITASPWTPPDPALAVGPNHIVQTVNMELAFFSKTGTMEFQQRLDSSGSPGFFEELGSGDFCFDPKCFYDHYSNRFIVLALEVYQGIDEAWITIAISDDDNPHGVWYKYRTWAVVQLGSSTYWCDYPGLGYDADGFYVTNNLFRLTGNGSFTGGCLYRAFDKTPMLSGNPVAFNDIANQSAFSVQVAQNFGDNPAPYFVSRQNSTQLRVDAINDPHGNPSLSSVSINVPSYNDPPSATNPGGSLSVVGSRLMNAHWRDDSLWTCHTIASSSGTRGVARWYEVDMNGWPSGSTPTLAQSGEIDLGGGNHTFFPAIYTNKFGNAAMVCAKSSSTENPSVQGVGRLTVDPLGTMGAPTQLVLGPAGSSGRWGDYFDIAIDPNDDRTFWMVGEYAQSNGWRTWIDSFTLEELLTPDSFVVATGTLNEGTVSDLSASDDQYVEVKPEAGQNAVIEVTSTSPTADPAQMWFTLEANSSVNFGVYRQIIELFNYDTDDWEEVDLRNAVNNVDATTTIQLTGDLSRFVQPGTKAIEARLSINRARIQYTIGPRYVAKIDHVEWTISE